MIHTMKLHPKPFLQIESGQKTIELRLYDEKRQKIKVGDTILFTNRENEKRTLSAVVTALHRFHSFKELYASLPLTKCGYTTDTVSTADHRDMQKYYDTEQEERFGVVGIEFSLIK